MTQRLIRIGIIVLLVPAAALAQALPNLTTARVRYNTLKNTTNPQGELKAALDAIDTEIAEAQRNGRTGEIRRLFAKGTALMTKRPWTDVEDFDESLVVRADRVFVDSTQPYFVRLEQIYTPSIKLTNSLTARAAIRPFAPPQPAAVATPAQPAAVATPAQPAAVATPAQPEELGRFDGVGRDLRESPFGMELNLTGLTDGPYTLDVEVLDEARSLGTASLRIAVVRGLDDRVSALNTAAARAAPAIKADLQYPIDFMKKVNRGIVETSTFDVTKEIAAAEAIATAAKGNANPFAKRTGDFERHYVLEPAGEVMPYRVYVPRTYDGSKAMPLMIALHGLGTNEDSFFDSYSRRLPELAEQHGYLVAAPLGYRVDGFYGSAIGGGGTPAIRRARDLSEQDVMQVLERMRREYKVDPQRIYLMGHSMGAIGTWHMAAKYPQIWAAIAPFSGMAVTDTASAMKQIPQFVVHGDNDATVNVAGSRTMIAELKKLGADVTYVEVAGGSHISVVVPNLAAMMDFFNTKRKAAPASQ